MEKVENEGKIIKIIIYQKMETAIKKKQNKKKSQTEVKRKRTETVKIININKWREEEVRTVDPADGQRLEDGEEQQAGSAAGEVVIDLEDVQTTLQPGGNIHPQEREKSSLVSHHYKQMDRNRQPVSPTTTANWNKNARFKPGSVSKAT